MSNDVDDFICILQDIVAGFDRLVEIMSTNAEAWKDVSSSVKRLSAMSEELLEHVAHNKFSEEVME